MKSDAQLQSDVMDELRFEPSVEASNIGVAVKDHIVTLTGTVQTFGEKWAAESAVKRVSGTKAVVERIKVELPSHHKRDDSDIARAAVHALDWNVSIPKDSVKAKVEEGYVMLTGEVPWRYQSDAAYAAVRNLPGVVGVTNGITVSPRANARDVKMSIEKEFERNARIDARNIVVLTEGGKVTLKGTVQSWAEHDEAARAAWSAPGVQTVQNLTSVAPR